MLLRLRLLLMQELKVQGVQFIVAPYEADAQMAYLARRGDVQLVITEDSDLLAYGCPRCGKHAGNCKACKGIRSYPLGSWRDRDPLLLCILWICISRLSVAQFDGSMQWYKTPLCASPRVVCWHSCKSQNVCGCLLLLCCRVLYKLDRTGNGEELCTADLPNCTGLPLSGFTSDQFLQLCVMAGCDFLAQLPGIGLKKAHGVLRKYRSFTKVWLVVMFVILPSMLRCAAGCGIVKCCEGTLTGSIQRLRSWKLQAIHHMQQPTCVPVCA